MLTPEIIARVNRWLAASKRNGANEAVLALAHEWSRRPFRIAAARTNAAREAIDSAMMGVLLALVREARGDESKQISGAALCQEPDGSGCFRVYNFFGDEIGFGRTEAEALIAALEAAPLSNPKGRAASVMTDREDWDRDFTEAERARIERDNEDMQARLDAVRKALDGDLKFDLEYMSETVWLVAEAFGADRNCPGCQKVVRHMDRREVGTRCGLHWSPER